MASWMESGRGVAVAVAVALAAALPGAARAADAAAGARLVQQWCVTCHASGSARASDSAPALSTIAHDRGGNPGWLRAWLANPHPPMPNLNLSNREIDDIVAHLATLRR